MNNTGKLWAHAFLIALIGVFVIDYFSHLLFSSPMETTPYFLAKFVLYFLYSLVFLSFVRTRSDRLSTVVVAGVIVSLTWGAYYNILPVVLNYYPFGISLSGITFLGMGLVGTGIAFGVAHTLAFVGGYYASTSIFRYFGSDDGV